MRFLHGKIKAYSGEKITVNISKPTRILIMPEREFNKYKNNLTFTYYGGAKDGSYEFTVPKAGTWIVVIEKGTYHKPMDIEVSISKEKPVKQVKPAEPKKKKKKKKGKENDEEVAEANQDVAVATEEPKEE